MCAVGGKEKIVQLPENQGSNSLKMKNPTIQQFNVKVYHLKNWNQGLEKVCVHSCSPHPKGRINPDIHQQSDSMWNDGKMMEAEEVAWRIKHLLCRSEG